MPISYHKIQRATRKWIHYRKAVQDRLEDFLLDEHTIFEDNCAAENLALSMAASKKRGKAAKKMFLGYETPITQLNQIKGKIPLILPILISSLRDHAVQC